MAEATSATLRPGPAQKSWQFPARTRPSTFMRTTTSLKSRASMGANRNWRGRINHFRFDPAQMPDLRVTIESVRLAPRAQ